MEAIVEQANTLFSSGEPDAVLRLLEGNTERNAAYFVLLGRAQFDCGDVDAAIESFREAATLTAPPDDQVPLRLLAMACVGQGCHSFARDVCRKLLMNERDDAQATHLLGLALMDAADFRGAERAFSAIVAVKPRDPAWYKLQVCRFYLAHGARRPDPFFSQDFKTQEAQNNETTLWVAATGFSFKEIDPLCVSVTLGPTQSQIQQWLPLADRIGALFHMRRTAGFRQNRRLCRAMGMGVLECVGRGKGSDWREFMGTLVRWRQNALSQDAVWWTSHEEPARETALKTPVYMAGRKVYRYRRYLDRILEVIRDKALGAPELSVLHEACRNALTPESLREAFGQDVSVSLGMGDVDPLPGPAFLLTKNKDKEGAVDLDVSAIMCDARKVAYDRVLAELFEKSDHLRFFYFWLAYQTLSRGTAICGLAALLVFLVLQRHSYPRSLIPPDVQWDWEAFLEPSDSAFARRVQAHLDSEEWEPFPTEFCPVPTLGPVEMRKLLSDEYTDYLH
jgi:tetratricopeptide (TPR) repeat protein